MKDLNRLSREIHENNVKVGWWNDDARGNPPCIFEKLQLVSTEIAEATEGERKDQMDDHLPDRKMAEVELADTLIRVLDIGGKLKLWYNPEFQPHPFINKKSSVGKQHLGINAVLVELADSIFIHGGLKSSDYLYSSLINSILTVADLGKYDIFDALEEKREYNKNRADHKLENRQGEVGQKRF